MITGIIWAVVAGVMLGLYVLPEKFTKGFTFENTWGLMFLINMLVVPFIANVFLVNDFVNVLQAIPAHIYIKMTFAACCGELV